ncbi:MAG TPA: ABC transporter substrate-binding protein [Vicinamibacterales bacterium]|nr:ABC transporter substrate-binding protein [Vicinamibacterales bacterium]
MNRVSGEVEPQLAKSWSSSADGLTWTFKLEERVTFSDGVPFTAADVLFTFTALYDKRVGSGMAGTLSVNGTPLKGRALDDHTVAITFPAVFGPGITLFDTLPILPRHKLQASLDAGTFRDAWNATTRPGEIVGLGPFVLKEYSTGTRLVLGRNPRYWKRDAQGRKLPYLDEIQIDIIPDTNAEVLRLESGSSDLMSDSVRPEDLAAFRRQEQQGVVKLVDAGVGIDPNVLWFNLVPSARVAKECPWLQQEAFRHAVSYAVDRQKIVDTVYLGAAVPIYGPVTPGHGEWYLPDLPVTKHDPSHARTLLGSIGLSDRNGDGMIEDASGKPARFTLLTQKGHTLRERTASLIQEHLRQVGIGVDIIGADPPSLFARYQKGDYDAIFFYAPLDSTDPARSPEFWMSSGPFHLWHPNQTKPATTWEATIDDLMRQQTTTLDPVARRRLFAEVQRLMSAHLPILHFAAPKITIAMSARLRGATPSVLDPPVLWNAEVLSVSGVRLRASGATAGQARDRQ